MSVGDAAGPPAASSATEGAKVVDRRRRESDFVTRVRRLTYDGKRPGRVLLAGRHQARVPERARAGNPFYQIFHSISTAARRGAISPGMGKTTCWFVRPGTGEVLFASTHHDPQIARPAARGAGAARLGRERRYAWDYDPEMELYVADAETLELRRLTNARGYDAEASFSPDGKWIAFSSTRSGYERAAVRRPTQSTPALETDPSFFGEIYIMRGGRRRPRRLTEVPGYDGGPFFFADGSRIVWRRFSETAGRRSLDDEARRQRSAPLTTSGR